MSDKPRRWFQIHLSTAVLATLTAGAVLGLNFWPARVPCETIMDFWDILESRKVSEITKSDGIKAINAKFREAWHLDGRADLQPRDLSYYVHFCGFDIAESGWPFRTLRLGASYDGDPQLTYRSSMHGLACHSVIEVQKNSNIVRMDATDTYDFENESGTIKYVTHFALKRGVRMTNGNNLFVNFFVGLLIISVLIIACETLIRRREARKP